MVLRSAGALFLALALASCAPPPRYPRDVSFADLPGWTTDRHAEAIPALLASCSAIARLPPDRTLGGEGELARDAGSLGPVCAEAANAARGKCRAAKAAERPPGD